MYLSAVVLALSALSRAAAGASVLPPSIDPADLPTVSEPAPDEPTEQRTQCAVAVPGGSGVTVPTAQAALDFADVWATTRGAGQVVAVIDTGVARHARLPDVIAGGDFVSTGNGIGDCDAHGTFVAGLIAARPAPDSGFAGGAPDAAILSIRQSSSAFAEADARQGDDTDAENSSGYGNVATMARAVRLAADSGATVVNISEVACGPAGSALGDGPLGAAVRYAAVERDVVVVAAAGNLGSGACEEQNMSPSPASPDADPWSTVSTVASPAWFDDYVLTVGSVDPDGRPSDFSLAGPWVDVAAPGTDMTSLDPAGTGLAIGTSSDDGRTVAINGTSFSAPLVSATAALVRARYPELKAAQVIERIEQTAHRPAEGWNARVGFGTIDPVAAVTNSGTDSIIAPISAASATLEPPAVAAVPDRRSERAALAGVGAVVFVTAAIATGAGVFRRRQPPPSSDASRSGSTPS
ncbi:putative protease [Rhodococcoides trifolii]|uniref:Protease n=1 Tax=Rhodococcoides trifolii TaxID=908250 RepID=A0A917FYJ4_9NOCA|nr:type VII secretion-associated serine protease mycosin [Rhodococcus trifolii]GGG14234.1 putative protease [Rhodococcus trifolii]